MTRRPDGGSTPSPITEQPVLEFWPASRAVPGFGGSWAGGLPAERFRRECRQQFRNLWTRWGRHYCAAGLRITYTNGAPPESVRLELLHAPSCPRFVA
jgi:hypothetical protein